jgi:hypothetical protein
MVAGMAETGQRCDEPLHKKEEGRSTQDTLAEPDLGGNHPLQMERVPLMDRTPPERAGRCMERVTGC